MHTIQQIQIFQIKTLITLQTKHKQTFEQFKLNEQQMFVPYFVI